MSGGQRDWKVLSNDQLPSGPVLGQVEEGVPPWFLWIGVLTWILLPLIFTMEALGLALDHAPRVLGLLSAGAIGWRLDGRLAKRVGRAARAYRVTTAFALASIAWAFVPTFHGRSPATVITDTWRIASALRSVDASDLEGFNRTSAERGRIEAWQFPTLRTWSDACLVAAERSWAEKVADELVAKLGALAPSDLEGFKAVDADPRLRLAADRGLQGRIDDAFSAWGKQAAPELVHARP